MERNEGEEGGREAVRKRMERKEGRGSEEDGEEGGREAVRKGEQGSEEDDYFNKFPRQWLQWFLKIDQSECSKSPIDLQQRNNTCVVPHSEHPQS
jgi:hypothetical protein